VVTNRPKRDASFSTSAKCQAANTNRVGRHYCIPPASLPTKNRSRNKQLAPLIIALERTTVHIGNTRTAPTGMILLDQVASLKQARPPQNWPTSRTKIPFPMPCPASISPNCHVCHTFTRMPTSQPASPSPLQGIASVRLLSWRRFSVIGACWADIG
jgi:hypothetical protein